MSRYSVGDPLTDTEITVLEMKSYGMSEKQIARVRICSRHTVKNHLDNVRTKLDADDTTHAVAIALREGILS